MIRLEKSEALRRKIRQDDVTELAIPTWTLVREAMRAGRTNEALDFLEYGYTEAKAAHDALVALVDDALTYLARFGEEEIEKFLRRELYPSTKHLLSVIPGVEESLQRWAEVMRAHYANVTIIEESDRYVVRCDPCGSGGRLRRTRSVATTKKAYPWSWGKTGVSYYCTHCCLHRELIPIELRGYPICVFQYADRPEDPCVHLYYKKPELIPEEYFTRIGKTKTIK